MSEAEEKIRVGDTIDVYFNTGDSILNAKVLRVPCDIGDWFVVKDKAGNICNVQRFNYMIKTGGE